MRVELYGDGRSSEAIAAALKSAKRRAATDSGADSLGAVAEGQHDVIDSLTGLFDGADATSLAGPLAGAKTWMR